jgi:hypothetical protein
MVIVSISPGLPPGFFCKSIQRRRASHKRKDAHLGEVHGLQCHWARKHVDMISANNHFDGIIKHLQAWFTSKDGL